MYKPSVLVVEDDIDLREALCDTLALADFNVLQAQSGEEALPLLQQHNVDMLVSDVNMPGIDGHELLKRVRTEYPFLPVLLITAYGSIINSVSAMREGAIDYLVKPFKPEVLINTLKKYINASLPTAQSSAVAVEVSSQQLLKLAHKVALSDATVLISGESGTGKEVLARYIHNNSDRQDQSFIAVNCAAIPDNMLEATLFGHEKGAFTGAYTSNPGKFEQAEGGTILLDEISEMDIGLQAKILRVLQEREVERVGGRKIIHLNVRIIATTNQDLKDCVINGTFREDLYYRLSVFPLQWLPLRERKKDILPIANRLLNSYVKKMNKGPVIFGENAEQVLQAYSWPGNVRELDNVIQRALIIQEGNTITASNFCLQTPVSEPQNQLEKLPEQKQDSEQNQSIKLDEYGVLGNDLKQREFEIIINTLKNEGGSRKQTAEKLGISPRTLRYKIARIKDAGVNLDSMLRV